MEVLNAVQLVMAPSDSHYRLTPCRCGNDQIVYLQNEEELWRAECLDCGNRSGNHRIRHDAQLEWNRRTANECPA